MCVHVCVGPEGEVASDAGYAWQTGDTGVWFHSETGLCCIAFSRNHVLECIGGTKDDAGFVFVLRPECPRIAAVSIAPRLDRRSLPCMRVLLYTGSTCIKTAI